jgi:hypothetical protein
MSWTQFFCENSEDYASVQSNSTTHQQQFLRTEYSPWCAISALNQGRPSQGWPIDFRSSGQIEQATKGQFVSVFGCRKEWACDEWYSDFAQLAQTQCDLLGHIIDWLRALSKRITVQRLVVQGEDPWMTADKLSKAARSLSPLPPSMFDIHWADKSNKVPGPIQSLWFTERRTDRCFQGSSIALLVCLIHIPVFTGSLQHWRLKTHQFRPAKKKYD